MRILSAVVRPLRCVLAMKHMDSTQPSTISEFAALFREFKVSAFRLETLQTYSVPHEDGPFKDFLAQRAPYAYKEQNDWARLVREQVKCGKSMARVHVVIEPPSPYLLFEISWPYSFSAAAGEDIRIVPVATGSWPDRIPRQDFWLFDSTVAAVMHYDDAGRFVNVQLERNVTAVSRFLRWKDYALRLSLPYQDYTKAL